MLSFRTSGKSQSDLYRDKQKNTATCGTITMLKRVVMGTFKKIMGSDRNMLNYVFLASEIFKNCHEAHRLLNDDSCCPSRVWVCMLMLSETHGHLNDDSCCPSRVLVCMLMVSEGHCPSSHPQPG